MVLGVVVSVSVDRAVRLLEGRFARSSVCFVYAVTLYGWRSMQGLLGNVTREWSEVKSRVRDEVKFDVD